MIKEGSIVVVFGELDNRIRKKVNENLIKGTLFYFLTENRVCVIIEEHGYELWIGDKKFIRLAKEQE